MLRSHYRQPMDWTLQGMKESWNILERWYQETKGVAAPKAGSPFLVALSDDLNTPQALAELHRATPAGLAGGLALLGFSRDANAIMRKADVDDATILLAIDARNAARKAKNFKEADRIRDELLAKGIVLKDGPSGTTWEVKR